MIHKESYNTNILLVNKSRESFIPPPTTTHTHTNANTTKYNESSLHAEKYREDNVTNRKPVRNDMMESNNESLASSTNSLLGVSGTNGISIFDIHEKEETLTVKEIRNLLILSFEQISKIAKENAIKAIETFQLRKFQEKSMNDILKEFKEYYKKFSIDNLFFESDEIAERNTMYIEFINDINKILNMIDNIDNIYK
jgi:hypothetical protein